MIPPAAAAWDAAAPACAAVDPPVAARPRMVEVRMMRPRVRAGARTLDRDAPDEEGEEDEMLLVVQWSLDF